MSNTNNKSGLERDIVQDIPSSASLISVGGFSSLDSNHTFKQCSPNHSPSLFTYLLKHSAPTKNSFVKSNCVSSRSAPEMNNSNEFKPPNMCEMWKKNKPDFIFDEPHESVCEKNNRNDSLNALISRALASEVPAISTEKDIPLFSSQGKKSNSDDENVSTNSVDSMKYETKDPVSSISNSVAEKADDDSDWDSTAEDTEDESSINFGQCKVGALKKSDKIDPSKAESIPIAKNYSESDGPDKGDSDGSDDENSESDSYDSGSDEDDSVQFGNEDDSDSDDSVQFGNEDNSDSDDSVQFGNEDNSVQFGNALNSGDCSDSSEDSVVNFLTADDIDSDEDIFFGSSPQVTISKNKPKESSDLGLAVVGEQANNASTSKQDVVVELDLEYSEEDAIEESNKRLLLANNKWNEVYRAIKVDDEDEDNVVQVPQKKWTMNLPSFGNKNPSRSILKRISKSVPTSYYQSTTSSQYIDGKMVHHSTMSFCVTIDNPLLQTLQVKPENIDEIDGMNIHIKDSFLSRAVEFPSSQSESDDRRSLTRSKKSWKKVSLNLTVQIRVLKTWSTAHQLARKGHWEQMRRDQMRFLRIISSHYMHIITPVLKESHREKIRREMEVSR